MNADSVRVNLTVPSDVDAVLTELSTVTGRSKTALVMEALGYQLPYWARFLDRVKTARVALLPGERKELERREALPAYAFRRRERSPR